MSRRYPRRGWYVRRVLNSSQYGISVRGELISKYKLYNLNVTTSDVGGRVGLAITGLLV